MYRKFYGLEKKPFQVAPDANFLYLSESVEEALTRMEFCLTENLGAVMISGIFGCGKTLLGQVFMEKMVEEKGAKVALIVNPKVNPSEFLREVLYQFITDQSLPNDKADMLHLLSVTLQNNVDDGKENLLVIDEAHAIEDKSVFEEIRLLLNLQYKNKFLINIILLGQPMLDQKIDADKPLTQRIPIRYHLSGFNETETKCYIQHRLKIAGREKPLIDDKAIKLIFESSGGIPRRINTICGMALLVGWGKKVEYIDEDVIREAIKSLEKE